MAAAAGGQGGSLRRTAASVLQPRASSAQKVEASLNASSGLHMGAGGSKKRNHHRTRPQEEPSSDRTEAEHAQVKLLVEQVMSAFSTAACLCLLNGCWYRLNGCLCLLTTLTVPAQGAG